MSICVIVMLPDDGLRNRPKLVPRKLMHGAGGAVFILIIKQRSINKHNGMVIPKFDSLLRHSAQLIAKFRPF